MDWSQGDRIYYAKKLLANIMRLAQQSRQRRIWELAESARLVLTQGEAFLQQNEAQILADAADESPGTY